MEVEVKLRLLSSAAHEHLSTVLSPHHRQTNLQENIFFDGPNSELSSKLAALRLRFYDLDCRCILSLKSKPNISAGISRIEEQEEPFDPIVARQCAAEPWRLLCFDSSSDIIRRVKEEFEVTEDQGLVCLGGFRNVRAVYEWNGLKLELDETQYDFGTCYEIECETPEPEIAKNLLEGLLKSNGIEYKYSEVSKFAIFRARKLPLCFLTFSFEGGRYTLRNQCTVLFHVGNGFCNIQPRILTCKQPKGFEMVGKCESIDTCLCWGMLCQVSTPFNFRTRADSVTKENVIRGANR